MKRAVLTGPGVAEWYEMCFCPTPLQHERQTQYNSYFTDMTTEPAEGYGEIQGASLWSYMTSKAKAAKTRSVDSKFAAPYIGWWPFVISRLRNNQVAFGAKQISSGRQDWEAPSRMDTERTQAASPSQTRAVSRHDPNSRVSNWVSAFSGRSSADLPIAIR